MYVKMYAQMCKIHTCMMSLLCVAEVVVFQDQALDQSEKTESLLIYTEIHTTDYCCNIIELHTILYTIINSAGT